MSEPAVRKRSRAIDNQQQQHVSSASLNSNGVSEYDSLLQKPPSLLQRQNAFLRRFFQVLGVSRRQFTQIVRNWRLLGWELLVPTVQICIFMLAIGAQPRNLPLGTL